MVENNDLVIQENIVVTLDYKLEVEGKQIDAGPIRFLHGHGNIIPGLEKEVDGMRLGEEKQVLVQAEEAYGHYDPELEVGIPRSSFPENFDLKLGRPMRMQDDKGNIFTGVAVAITNETVKMNLNHPLAGKDLLFETKVTDLRQATDHEIEQGHLSSGCSGCASSDCGDCN